MNLTRSTVTSRARNFYRRFGTVLAFLIVAAAAAWGVHAIADHASHQGALANWRANIHACIKTNANRHIINEDVIGSGEAQAKVLQQFLDKAAAARAAEYKTSHLESDKETAEAYAMLAVYDKTHVKYKKLAITNCAKAFPRP